MQISGELASELWTDRRATTDRKSSLYLYIYIYRPFFPDVSSFYVARAGPFVIKVLTALLTFYFDTQNNIRVR